MKRLGLDEDSHYNVLFHVILDSISLTWKSRQWQQSFNRRNHISSNFKRRYSPKYEENLDKGCVLIVYLSNKQNVYFEHNIDKISQDDKNRED